MFILHWNWVYSFTGIGNNTYFFQNNVKRIIINGVIIGIRFKTAILHKKILTKEDFICTKL
jgi:hypothetical protein